LSSSVSFPAKRHSATRLQPVGQLLQDIHHDLLISKQKIGQIQGIGLVRLKRDQGAQNLRFSSRPFALCGLPVRRLPKDQLLYERRNGNFVLQITGHPEFGVPFGQDRLGPIFLAALAVRQKTQVIRFHSLAEMLDGPAKVIQRSRFNFMSEAKIWYSRTPDPSTEFKNAIVLSDDFYNEVLSHPVPNDLEAVKVLAASPRFSTSICGFPTAASRRRDLKRCRFLGRTASLANWAQSSTRDFAGSGQCWSSGSDRFGPCGRVARQESERTAGACRSHALAVMRAQAAL